MHPLYLWLHAVVGNDPLSEHSGAWMTWLLIASTAVLIVTTRRLKPWLRGSHAPGDRHEVSSLPPEGCVVTATLGQIVQKEECRRRYGESRHDARGSVDSVGRTW